MTQHPAPQDPTKIGRLTMAERAILFAVVRAAEMKQTRKGDPFLVLHLADTTGQIVGKMWEDLPAEAPAAGTVVKIAATVEPYEGAPELRVNKMRPARLDEYDMADLVPATARNVFAMLTQLQAAADTIGAPALRALARAFFFDPEFTARYEQAPCTENFNHAYLGGLLEHTSEMLTLAEAMLTLYSQANVDLVRAGVLLANIGKIESYTALPFIGETQAHHEQGHILIGYGTVVRMIAKLEAQATESAPFDAAACQPLLHIIAAQSGRLEWGSPVSPKTIEAAIVHGVESLSAKANGLLHKAK